MNATSRLIIAGAIAALTASPALAAEKNEAGPKGGRLLDNESPRAEFFVEKDHTVTITFYGADMKPVPVGDQTAVIWADAKSGRVKLETERKGDALVSKTPLPEGDGYNVIVQLKSKPDAKAENFKITYHTEQCDKCKMAEYACICPPEKEHAHDHKPGEKEHKH
jgi:hypothetical protein